jgi:hypothetical protein
VCKCLCVLLRSASANIGLHRKKVFEKRDNTSLKHALYNQIACTVLAILKSECFN